MSLRVVEQRFDACLSEAAQRNWVKEHCILLECRRQAAFSPGPEVSEDNANQAFMYWRRLVALAADAPLFPLEDFANRLIELAPVYEEAALLVGRP
jgi:hypothetical protein